MAADRPWGKEVHGGVPICWPWFGGRAGYPSHGIVRYIPWRMDGGALGDRALPEKGGASRPDEPVGADLRAARSGGSGAKPPSFVVESTPETRAQWPHDFRLRVEFSMPSPDTLEITLTETNTGDKPFESGFGLHPYFALADAPSATLDGAPVPPQDGSTLKFPADGRAHVLGDPVRGIEIAVLCEDADFWRLWNPGEPNRYVAPGEWRRFFCLEPTRATPSTLASGATQTHVVRFRVRRTGTSGADAAN